MATQWSFNSGSSYWLWVSCPWSWNSSLGFCQLLIASLMVQQVKNRPAMWETWVQSLGWEDSLEKEMATHSSILAWKIPKTEEPGRLQPMGIQRVGHDWMTEHACMPLISKAWALFTAACILHKQAILINLLLAYHFASHWIPSVSRHKELELHWVLRWV